MIPYHWRGSVSNFGDELNTLLWPEVLPHFFDGDPSVRFVGIGSVMDRRHDGPFLKLAAGPGYGGYEPKPRLDESWIIHWVRGPHTARTLGLDPALGLGDPAALIPAALGISARPERAIGFMPHFESLARGAWREAAAMAGLRLLDPRDPPAITLRAMTTCRMVISEALHGIIVADALRIPWVAVHPLARIHRPKWHDWAATLDLALESRHLPASSLREWWETGRFARYAAPLVSGDGNTQRRHRWIHRAAERLSRLSEATPQLSSDSALDRCQSRQQDALVRLRRVPLPPAQGVSLGAAPFGTAPARNARAGFAAKRGPVVATGRIPVAS